VQLRTGEAIGGARGERARANTPGAGRSGRESRGHEGGKEDSGNDKTGHSDAWEGARGEIRMV